MKPALVLFAHGARDPDWSIPFEKMQRTVAATRPDLQVALAYLEFMSPPLEECISSRAESGTTSITIAPLFMAQGGHLKTDLPRMLNRIRDKHPETMVRLLPPAGEAQTVQNAIAQWVSSSTPRGT